MNTGGVLKFYDDLASDYHLLWTDWEGEIRIHGEQLNRLLEEIWGPGPHKILDASCGIGTQSLGLASYGHVVTGSDVSPVSVARAEREAKARSVEIEFKVVDLRELQEGHRDDFDVVISCDNALAHLQTRHEILQALRQMHACTRDRGGCVVSIRDYDRIGRDKDRGEVLARSEDATVFQWWRFEGRHYDMTMYILREEGSRCDGTILRERYHAIGIGEVIDLMKQAGFGTVLRRDDVFFQPIVIGIK